MGASDVFLHRSVSLFLWDYNQSMFSGNTRNAMDGGVAGSKRTPIHRFRHCEPSWFVRGHTTSFSASVDNGNELVRAALGGMAYCAAPQEDKLRRE